MVRSDWRDITPERCRDHCRSTFRRDLRRGPAVIQRSLEPDALHQLVDLVYALAIVILESSWLFAGDQRRPQLLDLQPSLWIRRRQHSLIQLSERSGHISGPAVTHREIV